MPPSLRHTFLAIVVAAGPVSAQDAPAINTAEILATLRQLRDAQTAQVKTAKQTAIQQAAGGAGSGERAAALWEEAVRVTQFQGVAKENAAFREWKERDGEGLKSKEAQSAARLFFAWLGLTLQRSNGVAVKDLLPQIISYTKEATAVDLAAEALEEAIKKERESAPAGAKRMAREKVADEQAVKRMVDQIFKRPLAASPVVQWMKVGDFVAPEKWEPHPGNVDGIFQKIILPELRAQKDARVLEYWDMKLKREAEAASARRAEFEITKFNTVRRPELLWNRAKEMAEIGQKNRAASEMLALIKANPTHPDTGAWIGQLEELLVPPTAPPPVPAPTVP
jgi:hypothetical protein